MRAAQITAIGAAPGPVDLNEPSARDGQALIAVTAAALNPVELRVAAGRMPGVIPPYVPGLEGVGTIIKSRTLPEGTRVRFENDLPGFGKDGAIRQVAVAEEAALVEWASTIDDATAAAAGVAGVTAELAFRLAGMAGGERVAVLGATGGVGQMAVQLAAAHGAASVVAAGRHRPTLDWLESNGASISVDLTESTDLPEALVEAAGGPLDIVVDPLWGAPAMGAIAALAERGRLVTVGNTAGIAADLPMQAMRKARSSVVGLSSGWTPLTEKLDAFRFVIGQVAAGAVKVNLTVEPLEAIESAWSRQERFPHTKIVVSLA
ncbi:MAG TPA: zinc-binding alcohol dehydrogenase family protein [Acidimicrobiia bacterium]|nr:zinc-binding alcohol dehydrogenase family protein [Acidimicrobiia bacterium]